MVRNQDVKTALTESGFRFKKQFGQNFLTDGELLASIAEAAGVTKDSVVVEIGPGAGTLTRELAKRAKQVYAFEIDTDLKPVLSRTLSGCDNVEVVFRDFMKVELASFEEEIADYLVVANIPYYITTPLVMRFLEEGKRVRSISVMIQEEVAERFCAEENTPEYGAITANIALRGRAEIVKRVPRTLFYPAPNVDSALVKITMEEGRLPVEDEATYHALVRCAFGSRRKTLENNLMASFHLSRERAQELLRQADIPDKTRGETLSPVRIALLANLLYHSL